VELPSGVQRQSLGEGLEANLQKLETNVHADFENRGYFYTIFTGVFLHNFSLLLPVY